MRSIGNYHLIEKIAEGGMGSVWKGRHRDSGEIVAVKIMASHLVKNPILIRRFEKEFRSAARLDHPNIVRVIEYNDEDVTPFLVMEFIEGESLAHRLDRVGRIGEKEAIRIITHVAQGLHFAHKNHLIHRDIKPSNILISSDNKVKLADLGLVRELEEENNLTRAGRGLGTPHFMAPEQFQNARGADIRCDIYSLGATLYMMVTGELPFKSKGPLEAWMKKIANELIAPRKIAPELSERVNTTILRSMSTDRELRPHSSREFIEDLTGNSTRRPSRSSSGSRSDRWYLQYQDANGNTQTVKGSCSSIRKSIQDGLLGTANGIGICRQKTGPFEPLDSHPEFQDLIPTRPDSQEFTLTGEQNTPEESDHISSVMTPQIGPWRLWNQPLWLILFVLCIILGSMAVLTWIFLKTFAVSQVSP